MLDLRARAVAKRATLSVAAITAGPTATGIVPRLGFVDRFTSTAATPGSERSRVEVKTARAANWADQ